MKDSEELLQSAGETVEYVRQYIDQQQVFIKLEIAERTSKIISSLLANVAVFVALLLVVIFASVTLGFLLSSLFDSNVAGFGIVTLLYVIVGCLVYLFRENLVVNPVVEIVIKKMFD